MLLLFFWAQQDAEPIHISRYRLGDQNLPRPKYLRREFVWVKSDIVTLSGRTTRDISSRKEKWILGWEVMSKSELTILLALLEENGAVDFSVNDTNLNIAATPVFPYVSAINYDMPGSTYFAKLECELIEQS